MLETLKNGLRKFFNFVRPRTKLGTASFIVFSTLAVFCLFVFVLPVSADDFVLVNYLVEKVAQGIISLAGLFIQLAIFFLKFTIEVASYNGYINSSPVELGWTLVRDIANMFFVVILLIIAFATVLGLENYSWKKLLMKFLLAAILVNFSRIICGVIIDAAQVFMTTFVNGLAATAGGNLIQAFHLDSILSFSPSASSENMQNVNILTTALAATFFAALAAFTVAAYLVLLVIRAVVLWVLIILSPLAFVLNVIPKTQSYAAKWWSTFGNEVVAGPVLVFFLWLSFAVAGSGNIHDQFQMDNANSLDNSMEAIRQDASVVGEMNSNFSAGGLGEILEWDNMANFIIATAMLLVGVRVTKELGAAGGGAMGGIVDFGRRVATVATGVAAARYLARGAAEGVKKGVGAGAKFVAMKMPGGGEFWQNIGMGVKGRVGTGLEKWGISRDERAAKLDKIAADTSKGAGTRLWAGLKSKAIQTNFYARKKAEAWGESVEHLKKEHDAYTSVSATAGGRFKEEAASRRFQAEEFQQVKIAEKAARLREDWNKTERGAAKEKLIRDTALKGEAGQAALTAAKEEALAEERRRLMVEPPGDKGAGDYQAKMRRAALSGAAKKIADLDTEAQKTLYDRDAMGAYARGDEGKSRIGEMLGKKATAEYRTMMSDRDTNMSMAKAKDAQWASEGKIGGFQSAESARQIKEENERIAVMSYDKAMAAAQELGDRLKDPKLSDDERKRLKELSGNMALANFKRGSAYALGSMNNFYKGAKIKPYDVEAGGDDEAKNAQNFVNAQANVLTYFSGGEQVENTPEAVRSALAKIREERGDNGEMFLEEITKAIAETSEDAAINSAGLFVQRRNEDGKISVDALDWNNEEDRKIIKDKREYAATTSKFGKTGLSGSLDSIDGELRINSEQARQNVASMFESMTKQSYNRVDKKAINDLAQAVINAKSDAEREALSDALAKGISGLDGYTSLVDGINNAIESKGSGVKLRADTAAHGKYHAKGDKKKESAGAPPETPEERAERDADAHEVEHQFNRAMKEMANKIGETMNKTIKEIMAKAVSGARGSVASGEAVDMDDIVKKIADEIKNNVSGSAEFSGKGIDLGEFTNAVATAFKEALNERARKDDRKKREAST